MGSCFCFKLYASLHITAQNQIMDFISGTIAPLFNHLVNNYIKRDVKLSLKEALLEKNYQMRSWSLSGFSCEKKVMF